MNSKIHIICPFFNGTGIYFLIHCTTILLDKDSFSYLTVVLIFGIHLTNWYQSLKSSHHACILWKHLVLGDSEAVLQAQCWGETGGEDRGDCACALWQGDRVSSLPVPVISGLTDKASWPLYTFLIRPVALWRAFDLYIPSLPGTTLFS